MHEHINNLHARQQGTLSAVRSRFWLLSASSTVRGVLRKCVRCSRVNPTEIMGDLLTAQVNLVRPFLNCDGDYFGPFQLKQGFRKKISHSEGLWGNVFVFCDSRSALGISIRPND